MNASSLVPDELWEAIESLLPKEPPKHRGGRPRVCERAALGGIVFVLRTGCPWRLLPKELGCGSGTTCWRRLRDWQEAGVWQKLHERLLNWLGDEAAIDWSRASVDSLSVRAKRGASRSVPTRLTEARPAPNTTWSSTATASPWPSTSPPLTPTTRRCSFPWSTRSPRSSALGETGEAAQAPGQAPRRQGVRLLGLAPCPASPRHHSSDRAARTRFERAARAIPVGRRAHLLLAARLSSPGDPLRAAGRSAAGAAPLDLRPPLPALSPLGSRVSWPSDEPCQRD
jgi:transposase